VALVLIGQLCVSLVGVLVNIGTSSSSHRRATGW